MIDDDHAYYVTTADSTARLVTVDRRGRVVGAVTARADGEVDIDGPDEVLFADRWARALMRRRDGDAAFPLQVIEVHVRRRSLRVVRGIEDFVGAAEAEPGVPIAGIPSWRPWDPWLVSVVPTGWTLEVGESLISEVCRVA